MTAVFDHQKRCVDVKACGEEVETQPQRPGGSQSSRDGIFELSPEDPDVPTGGCTPLKELNGDVWPADLSWQMS